MGYYFISFHAPCKGFYDLVVFVITNDLSDSALRAADEGSSDEPGGGAQSNKALRDEVREEACPGKLQEQKVIARRLYSRMGLT